MLGIKNMKKLIPILTVFLLILSGIGAVAFSNEDTNIINVDFKTVEKTIEISSIKIESYDNEYNSIRFDDVSNYVMKPGQPMIPS